MSYSCNVLMIFPKFNPKSFWSYDGACDLLGAKYPAAPLGMITLAALLPRHGMFASSTAIPRSCRPEISPGPTSS